jgi:N-methylhydantoinase A
VNGRVVVAVDIGGTFTDIVGVDVETGETRVVKVLTTPLRPVAAVATGVDELLAVRRGDEGVSTDATLASVIHATTLATNIVTEGKGARVLLLTTDGFRDVLETRREGRYDSYDLQIELPQPLVPRRRRLGVAERVSHSGAVLEPLAEEEIRRVVELAVDAAPESVAVCLLHSYANAEHEHALEAALAEALPGVPITLSSSVLPRRGEFDRLSATVVNSYVRPSIEEYLGEFDAFCRELGQSESIFMMLSNGGVASLATAGRLPVRMIESGPAAGAIGASRVAASLGLEQVVSFDMGGTTAKACLIEGFEPHVASSLEVARLQRFAPGSGYPLAIPSVDLLEVGAGGGSIARLDDLGLLQVGPESAGADPGPACYGNGGTEPTVTDADLVLGLLNPEYFLGGKMTIRPELAAQAIDTHLGAPLRQDTVTCAWGIFELINENMARAVRLHALERGVDPRACSMIAFGGAGPVHACAVAAKLGIDHVVFPVGAGVGSAFGLAVASRMSEATHVEAIALDALDPVDGERIFRTLVDAALEDVGVVDEEVLELRRHVDLRVRGQLFEITVPVAPGGLEAVELATAFGDDYERRFGRRPGGELELINWRIQAVVPGPLAASGSEQIRLEAATTAEAVADRRRRIFYDPSGPVEALVRNRYALRPGDTLAGPAIVEEHESTIVVPTGYTVSCDVDGTVHARREGGNDERS